MALAEVGRQGSANREGKRITEVRSRTAAAGSSLRPALMAVKYDPNWQEGATDGQQVTSADVVQAADTVTFNVDGGADAELTPVDWNTEGITQAIQRVAKSKRWIAQYADSAPNFSAAGATAGVVVGAQNALLGVDPRNWVYVTANVDTLFGIGVGVKEYYSNRLGREVSGSNMTLPGLRETGYVYPLQPLATPVHVGRGGGINANLGEGVLKQRASKFRSFEFDAEAQKAPTTLEFTTEISRIYGDLGVFTGDRLIRIINSNGVTVFRAVAAGNTGIFSIPVNVVVYGPAWVLFGGGTETEAIDAGDSLAVDATVRIA